MKQNEKAILDFKKWLNAMGHFHSNYETADELILKFSSELEKVVQSDFLTTAASDKVHELALEYESTRKSMPLSDQRTLAMELIKDKMILIAPDIITMLPILTKSKSPGERLAAIACLQQFPHPEYFNWLAIHVGDAEEHFVGYHASIALEEAVKD